jgi:Rab-like protein 5
MGGGVKVLVVGPQQSGKSCVCNALGGVAMASPESDAGDGALASLRGLPYRPTAGVRVVELDQALSAAQARRWGGKRELAVELWDVSGNTKYESCWPALQKGALGVVLVYNAENDSQAHEVATWFEWFVEKAGLRPEQCLVLANDRNSGSGDPRAKPPPALDECEMCYTDADDLDKIRTAFQDFCGALGSFVK